MLDGPWWQIIWWGILVGLGFTIGATVAGALLGLIKKG